MDRIMNSEFFEARLQTAKSLKWLHFTAINLSDGGEKKKKQNTAKQTSQYRVYEDI